MPFWSSKKKAEAKGSVESPEVSSWRVLAEQCIDQGNHVDAINFYTAILSKHPKDVPALLGRSMARMLPEPTSYDLAIKDADAAIDAKHDSWQAWKQKGRVLAAAGRPGEAEQALQHAMRLASSADLFGIRELLNQVKQQRSSMQIKSPAGTSTLSPASLSPLPSGSRSPLVTPTEPPPDSHSPPTMLPNTPAAPVQQASTSDCMLLPLCQTSYGHADGDSSGRASIGPSACVHISSGLCIPSNSVYNARNRAVGTNLQRATDH